MRIDGMIVPPMARRIIRKQAHRALQAGGMTRAEARLMVYRPGMLADLEQRAARKGVRHGPKAPA